jgi:hypothetical protein
VTFPLDTEKYQEDVLNKRFEIGRKIYNAVLSRVYNRYRCLAETKACRLLQQQIKNANEKQRKELYKTLKQKYKEYRLNEYALHEDVKRMQHHFKQNIDAFTAQKLATRVWKAMEDLLYGDGEKVHFKRYGELSSLEGKSNQTGIRFKDNQLIWNGLKIGVKIDDANPYEIQALQDEICYCRIKRNFVREKFKYALQIVFKGSPPLKINKHGEIKRRIGIGTVGLDIGTQSIAISSHHDVKLLELADRVQNIENQKRRYLRYMDRSKRANHPENFNEDGTIKKGRLTWKRSNKYIKAQSELKELYRKQADIRAYQHHIMSNYILSLGDTIYVEDMNFKALQRRSKKTEISKKMGKIKKKKDLVNP